MIIDPVTLHELKQWQDRMRRKPNIADRLSKGLQNKVNSYIPEKVHRAITTVVKNMIRSVLFGAKYVVPPRQTFSSLQWLEVAVDRRIDFYKHTAAAEGGITGAGGFLAAMADFPILLGIKLKLLFDIATLYGFDVKDYKERLFILHVFGLAFSSQQYRRHLYLKIEDWTATAQSLPEDVHQFEWRPFQQEYRDYIDLAKLAQMIPGIGAVVGFVVNYRLIKKLGDTAKNAYRMRLMQQGTPAIRVNTGG